jgi:hypothetical protein
MSDIYLLGGSTAIHQMDAVDSYPSSGEVATSLLYRTKAYAPAGWNDEIVVRRLLVTVQYDSWIDLTVALYLDGRLESATVTPLFRSQGSERHTFVVPVGVPLANGHAKAVRGTSVQVEFRVQAPSTRWYINPPVVQWMPALSTRRAG